jgi:DNA-directed RNA polymerase subunit RPC12/RpoP
VLKYWDESANGSASNYTANSGKLVLWKCEKGHFWSKRVAQQVNHNTCPECAGEVLVKGVNDVATKYHELICEWDWDNNKKAPTELKASVQLKCWWKCEKGHSYEATIWNRKLGKSCPYCNGKRPILGKNDLKTLFSVLAEEWDYERNRKVPDEYLPKSNSRVWWKCKNGHSWKALISERTRGTNCPYCNK